jgi:type I restriction enzyme S subunit
MASLNQDIIRRIPVTVPSPEVQERVVDVLSAYDDLIENNRRRMVLLEESARLLYREWFVRLRFPGHEHTPLVNGLPEGWRQVTIGDHIASGAINLQTGPFGTQLRASDYVEAGTPVINVRNIGYGDLRSEKIEFVPDDVLERLGVHILLACDIVFGRKGAVDRHLLITKDQAGWMQGSDCIRLRSLSESVCPVFLSFVFREEGHRQWMLNQCGNKATMASLNQEVIARIPVLEPRSTLLAEFREFTGSIMTQIASMQRQMTLAANARDLLLPRLMSGEVTV